jgi:hypothetical protein
MPLTQVQGQMLNGSTNTTTTIQSNGTTAITIDASQNVGVGTSSPLGKFDVGGASTATVNTGIYVHGTDNASYGQFVALRRNGSNSLIMGDAGAILGSGGGASVFYTYGANYQAFWTNGTERMRIDSAGNVGVGITPSGNYQLQAGSGSSAAGRGFNLMTVSGGFSGGDYPSIGYNYRTTTTSGSYLYNASDIAAQIVFSSAGTIFNTAASGTTGNTITFSEQMRLTSAGLLQFNSGYGSVATAYGCRAWVNFNGTGTVAIRNSGNVSSITDGGIGVYTVNITTALTDANAAPVASGQRFGGSVSRAGGVYANMSSSSAIRVFTGYEDTFSGAIPTDLEYVQIAVFR